MFALVPFALAAFFAFLSVSDGIPFLLLVAAFFAAIGVFFVWVENLSTGKENLTQSSLDQEEA